MGTTLELNIVNIFMEYVPGKNILEHFSVRNSS
jgi:hypothetical protein